MTQAKSMGRPRKPPADPATERRRARAREYRARHKERLKLQRAGVDAPVVQWRGR